MVSPRAVDSQADGFPIGKWFALVKGEGAGKAMKAKTNVKAGYIGETEKNLR